MRSLRITAARVAWCAALVLAAVLSYWVVAFALTFELLGSPVRSVSRGWLGPPPRDGRCMENIGKVWEWTCKDIDVFEQHRFGARLWLRLNGLAPDDTAPSTTPVRK